MEQKETICSCKETGNIVNDNGDAETNTWMSVLKQGTLDNAHNRDDQREDQDIPIDLEDENKKDDKDEEESKQGQRKVQFTLNPHNIITPMKSKTWESNIAPKDNNKENKTSNTAMCNYIRMDIPCTSGKRCRFRHNVTSDPKDQSCGHFMR